MSNYPNMSYCMNQNTLASLRQVVEAMQDNGLSFVEDMNDDESRAYEELYQVAEEFMRLAEEFQMLQDEAVRASNN